MTLHLRGLGLACLCLLGCSNETTAHPGNDGGVVADSGTPGVAALPGSPACANNFCWFAPASFGDDLNAVWAANGKDMWAVGERGTIVHYDGAQWTHTAVGTTTLYAIWGSSSTSIWAVGGTNTVLRYDGSTWTPLSSAPTGSFNRIVGTSDTDVWLFGGTDAAHFDGAAWSTQKLPATVTDAKRVGSEVWILAGGSVLRLSGPGATPTSVTLPAAKPKGAYTAIVASSPTSAWAVGTEGTAAQFDGSTWKALSVGTTDIRYATITPNGDVYGASQGSVFRLNATRWDRVVNVAGNPGVTENLKHAYATPEGHVWAVGGGGATAFFDGATWFRAGGRISTAVSAIHGSSSDDVWIAANFDVRHFRSGAWTGASGLEVSFPSDILATAVDEAWAISGVFNDTLAHSKGWALHKFDKQTFSDLSASARDDVWAVGSVLKHYDGSAWTDKMAPAAGPWKSVWQSSRTDVWLGSDAGIYRGDGATFAPVTTGATGALRMIRGTSANDVWALYETDVRHFDGTTWESRSAPASFAIHGLATAANNDAWAWGKAGAVLHYTGGAWTEIALPTTNVTRGIFVSGSDVWVGTAEGGLLRTK